MARVNVDSQALLDARFAVLSGLMGLDDPDYAMGKMVRLWMQCIERETYVITQPVIVALFRGNQDAPTWLIQSELAEEVEGGLRIKGTRGRIEYLAEQRARARENGTKGGRPAKPTSVVGNNQRRGGSKTPPTPAPTPAPTPVKETPLPPELDCEEFKAVWKSWGTYRQEIKKKLTPTTAAKQIKTLAAMGRERAIRCIEYTIGQGWTGLYEPDAKGGRTRLDLGEQFRSESSKFREMMGDAT